MDHFDCPLYSWDFTVQAYSIAPGQVIALSPRGMTIPKAVLVAEMTNFTHICIGKSNILCNQTTGVTNGALMQLMAGTQGIIEVDNPFQESFDLGDYYATQPDATHTVLLFVAIYQVQRLGAA